MSILIEVSGAQVLPRPIVPDERRTVTEWQAVRACSGDERAKFPVIAGIAGRLVVLATGDTR